MNKLNYIFCALAASLILACASKQVGLKENWIDERDMISLASTHVSEWMVKAGYPTLVEISGDTSIYYYNYRPTMYASTVYDSTTVLSSTWGTAKELKPSLENSTEIWGSRKNTMQIKVVKDIAVSAVVTAGPDKQTFVRDLNGNLVLDPMSGYNSNISLEQKINKNSEQFKSAYGKLYGKEPSIEPPPVAGTNMSPWEYYRYKQQLDAIEQETAGAGAGQPVPVSEPQPGQPVSEPQPGQPIAEPQPMQPIAEPQPGQLVPATPETPAATEPPSIPYWQ
jgi:hypothetical protein